MSFFLKTEHACCDNSNDSGKAANNTLHDKNILQSKETIAMEKKIFNEMRILFSLLYEYFFEMVIVYCVINLAEEQRIYYTFEMHYIKRDNSAFGNQIVIYSINIDDLSSKIRNFIVWGIN